MKVIPNDIFFQWVEENLRESGSVRFRVKGVSMQPLLRNEREEVTLSRYEGQRLERGDIVLFKYNGRHVLHRILKEEGPYYILRGDNAINCERCTREDILGIVTKVHRPCARLYNTLWPVSSAFVRIRNYIAKLIRSFFR